MSQRPTASRPASRSPPDGQRITLPPVQLRDDLAQGARGAESQHAESENRPSFSHLQESPQHVRSQNPLGGDEWRTPAATRDLGVHSILNPVEPEGSRSSGRHNISTTTESPSSAVGQAPPFGTSPSTSTPHVFPGQQSSTTPPVGEGYVAAFPRAPRRILTPRSPSRALSAARRVSQGAIDAQQSPFLPARGHSYIADPGPSASSELPPVPPPPGQGQSRYGFPPGYAPPATSTPPIAPRRTSGGAMQAPTRTPLSQSTSPSISASSHNPPSSQTSPASFLYQQQQKGGQTAQTPTAYYPGSSFGTSIQQGGGMQFQGPPGASEGPYSAPAPPQRGSSLQSSSADSSRQTSASDPIQVLTITTSQGVEYAVPVDVHQASRLADQKRARNAGASARFRQRRKEKERDANISIDKLQQQAREQERKIRELENERDFYRGERDRFRDVLYRTPDMRHLAMQSPPSPQSMRGGPLTGSIGQMGGPPAPQPSQMGYQPVAESSERPARRRRTSTQGDYTGLPYSLPPASTLPPVQAPEFATGPVQGQLPPSLPPLRMDNPDVPQSGPPNHPPSTTAESQPPYDPYGRGPYERGWPSDGGRR